MAAHLHDSVLQTLALIQRAKAPREMASLARTQERELRAWLYGRAPELAGVRLRDAIDAMAGRIERQHQVSVEAMVVGDAEMDDQLRALVNACAEAVANAATHSGSTSISVYVEVEDERGQRVRARPGRRLRAGRRPVDRRGIADSIVGRMERRGGSAPGPQPAGSGDRGRPAAAPEGVVTIRVFVVDDHELFRSGVRSELGGDLRDRGRRRLGRGGGAGDRASCNRTSCCSTSTWPTAEAGSHRGGAARAARRSASWRSPCRTPRRTSSASSAPAPGATSPSRSRPRSSRRPCTGSTTAIRSSHPGWPGSSWTPSPARRRSRSTRSSTCSAAREREVLRYIARGYTLQGGRARAAHLGQDGRDARLGGAAQAPALEPIRADPLGRGPPPRLMRIRRRPEGRRLHR